MGKGLTKRLIRRGDLVRKTKRGLDYYGTALTDESRRPGDRVRIDWHPDFGAWEDPADLTAISVWNLYDPRYGVCIDVPAVILGAAVGAVFGRLGWQNYPVSHVVSLAAALAVYAALRIWRRA